MSGNERGEQPFIENDELISQIPGFISLSKIQPKDLGNVGRKAYNLHRIINETDLCVPDGFVICDGSMNDLLALKQKIDSLRINPNNECAVRSSSAIEDGDTKSHSGSFRTETRVNQKDLLDSIERVWLSSKSADGEKAPMGVIVQKYIDADVSGVTFTANPATNNKDTMLVEAVLGPCELLVSGKITPSRWTIDRTSDEVASLDTILSKEQLEEIYLAAQKIENIFGVPMDIEWCFKNQKLYILQARPITTIDMSQKINIEELLDQIEWDKTVNRRPDTLFKMSLNSDGIIEGEERLFGTSRATRLLIQDTDTRFVHAYRSKDYNRWLDEQLVGMVNTNPEKLIALLEHGLDVNQMVQTIVNNGLEIDFPELINLCKEFVFIDLNLPFFILALGEKGLINNNEILDLCRDFRTNVESTTFFTKVVLPKSQEWLKSKGLILSIEEVGRMSCQEVLDFDTTKMEQRQNGRFYYFRQAGDISIVGSSFVPESLFRVENTDDLSVNGKKDVSGSIAWPGHVIGIARLVERIDDLDRVTFNEGEILVTSNASPMLKKLMLRAGAIVVDEGGIGSHAANIARELSKPTIIGTINETKVIKDGVMIEIIARSGEEVGKVLIIEK